MTAHVSARSLCSGTESGWSSSGLTKVAASGSGFPCWLRQILRRRKRHRNWLKSVGSWSEHLPHSAIVSSRTVYKLKLQNDSSNKILFLGILLWSLDRRPIADREDWAWPWLAVYARHDLVSTFTCFHFELDEQFDIFDLIWFHDFLVLFWNYKTRLKSVTIFNPLANQTTWDCWLQTFTLFLVIFGAVNSFL